MFYNCSTDKNVCPLHTIAITKRKNKKEKEKLIPEIAADGFFSGKCISLYLPNLIKLGRLLIRFLFVIFGGKQAAIFVWTEDE